MQISWVVLQKWKFPHQKEWLFEDPEHIASGLPELKVNPCDTTLPLYQPVRELCRSWLRTLQHLSPTNSPLKVLCQNPIVAQLAKYLPAMWKTWVWSLGWEYLLEKGKATHFSIQAWRILWSIVHGVPGVTKSQTWLATFISLHFWGAWGFSGHESPHLQILTFQFGFTVSWARELGLSGPTQNLKISMKMILNWRHLKFNSCRQKSSQSISHLLKAETSGKWELP